MATSTPLAALPHPCGEILSSSECVAAVRQDYNVREHVDPEADFVPTLNEVTARFSRLQTGKAVGEDHLSGELLPHLPARAGATLASHFCQGRIEVVRTMAVEGQPCA